MTLRGPFAGLACCTLLLSCPLDAARPADEVGTGSACSSVSSATTVPQVVAELEAQLASEMARQKVPGVAFAIVKDGQLVHAQGYGVKVLNGTNRVTDHTVFEVGSTTKAFTSALVGMLVDEGKLRWDDRVVDRLPQFKLYDPWVTKEFRVDDLMAQRSGMPGYSLDQMAILGWPRQDVAAAVAHVEPVYSARADFSYVNTLWLWAAALPEAGWGLSWENAMARRILGPLGMTESTVEPEAVRTLDDLATGHMTLASGAPWPIPADYPYAGWVDTYGPAGSLRSNVVDMSKWARMHLANGAFEGQQILSAETVARLHGPRTTAMVSGARMLSYAQGWMYDSRTSGPVVWHNGGTSGMHSIVALYPTAGFALVVLTNTNGNTIPELMDAKLYGLLFPVAAGASAAASLPSRAEPRFDPSRLPLAARAPNGVVPPLPNSRYAGSYSNPAYGTVAVVEKNGALVLRIGPKNVEMPLTHYAGNVFRLTLPGDPEWSSPATFTMPSGGSASRVLIEAFADVKGGWFERTNL